MFLRRFIWDFKNFLWLFRFQIVNHKRNRQEPRAVIKEVNTAYDKSRKEVVKNYIPNEKLCQKLGIDSNGTLAFIVTNAIKINDTL